MQNDTLVLLDMQMRALDDMLAALQDMNCTLNKVPFEHSVGRKLKGFVGIVQVSKQEEHS